MGINEEELRFKLGMGIQRAIDKQRKDNQQPKVIRILNDILNVLWRNISMVAIITGGTYITGEISGRVGYLADGSIWSVFAFHIIVWSLLITTFVFAMRQLLVSKDIIHIEVKIEKEKKTNE